MAVDYNYGSYCRYKLCYCAVLNCGDCWYNNKHTSPVRKRRTNREDIVLSTVKITVLINING